MYPFKKSSFQIAPAQRIDFLIKIKNKNLNLFENSTSKPIPHSNHLILKILINLLIKLLI